LAFTGLTVTTQGANLQTKVQAGTTMSFSKIKVGDGTVSSSTTLSSFTALVDSQLEVEIESVTSMGDGTYRVRGTLTNSSVTTGFFLREIGLFATDPDDGDIMYAYANSGDECDYLPAGGGSVVVESVIDLITAVGSASSVTATIDEDSVLVSLKTFNTHVEASPIDHPDSSVTTAKIADSAVTTDKINDSAVTTAKINDSAVSTAKINDSAVTDAKIGTRTIDDTLAATADADNLNNMLSKLAYMLKSITGQDNWYTAPDINQANTALGVNPSGAIVSYAGSSAPDGYLLCDGSTVSRTTYADLYDVIGTTYGTGDGSTTFALPDLQDKFVLGKGDTYSTLAATGGETEHTLTTDEMPSHHHTITGGTSGTAGYVTMESDGNSASTESSNGTNYTGGGEAHNNMPPYIVLNYIIKY